jgi:hypothetical protein
MWRIWWAPKNAIKWQMGFNSAFKGLMYVHGCNWKFYTTRSITLCDMSRRLGDRKVHKISTLQIFCLSENFITSPYMINNLHCMLQ